jgi:hypothetical protein
MNLAWKFGICVHEGKSEYFKGARQDWASSSLQLDKKKFHVNPGITVNDPGLCVMICDSQGKGLFKPIIHVLLNPIIKEGLPYPDIDAAATGQPNVIRKGQMGTRTNSNHVARAVGGYSGVSSSSITMKVDQAIVDERVATSSVLAMSHRSDTAHIMPNRYLDLPNDEYELKRLWRHYNF